MSSMKNLALPILEELFHNGPGFRKELWGRCDSIDWPGFKRVISMLHAQGMVEFIDGDQQKLIDLTEEGSKVVQELFE
jgi:predicted transcriptional regulator